MSSRSAGSRSPHFNGIGSRRHVTPFTKIIVVVGFVGGDSIRVLAHKTDPVKSRRN